MQLTIINKIIVRKDVEKSEPLCTAGRNANLCSHNRKEYGESSKIKNRTIIQPGNPLKQLKSGLLKKYLYSHVHGGNILKI